MMLNKYQLTQQSRRERVQKSVNREKLLLSKTEKYLLISFGIIQSYDWFIYRLSASIKKTQEWLSRKSTSNSNGALLEINTSNGP